MCIHVVHIKTHNKGCEGLHFVLITSVFINTLNKPVCCMLRVNYLIILHGLLRGVRVRSTDVCSMPIAPVHLHYASSKFILFPKSGRENEKHFKEQS